MTQGTYPELLSEEPSEIARVLREIVRLRSEDTENFNNQKDTLIRGRKVDKIPTAYNDVTDGDVVGDFSYDNTYAYILMDDAGTLKWLRLYGSTANPWATLFDGSTLGTASTKATRHSRMA